MAGSSGTRTWVRYRTPPRLTCWTRISICWWRQGIRCTRSRSTNDGRMRGGVTMINRRTFLQEAAAGGVLALAGGVAGNAAGESAVDWKKQAGLELYTVRDLTAKDYEGTLAKVAGIGYKEVEAATDYNKLEPREFRALLDRYGLSMPSTHVGATAGPDLEK